MIDDNIFGNGFENGVDNAVVEYRDFNVLFFDCNTRVTGHVYKMDCSGNRIVNLEVPQDPGLDVVLHVRTPNFENERHCELTYQLTLNNGKTYFFICEGNFND